MTTVSVGKGLLYKKKCYDDRAVKVSCRHARPSVFSLCLLMVRSRFLVRCLGLELFCVVLAKCLSSELSLKNWQREKLPCQTIIFLPFFIILFPIDKRRAVSEQLLLPPCINSWERTKCHRNRFWIFLFVWWFWFFPPFFCCCCQGSFPLMSERCREEGERGGGVQTRCANTYRTANLH